MIFPESKLYYYYYFYVGCYPLVSKSSLGLYLCFSQPDIEWYEILLKNENANIYIQVKITIHSVARLS